MRITRAELRRLIMEQAFDGNEAFKTANLDFGRGVVPRKYGSREEFVFDLRPMKMNVRIPISKQGYVEITSNVPFSLDGRKSSDAPDLEAYRGEGPVQQIAQFRPDGFDQFFTGTLEVTQEDISKMLSDSRSNPMQPDVKKYADKIYFYQSV